MKKTIAVLVGVMFSLFIALPASATENDPVMVVSDCLTDWYVNPDEGGADENQGDRRPEQTETGLLFSGNMLVHHAPEDDILLADLEPGTFVADPAPSLNSFFSVEVGAPGYATLRWDGTKWNVGGTDNYSDDPSTFVGVKGLTAESHVLSFGVGYVNTPNNGTETTVSSVTFADVTYDLTCAPEPTPTPEPTTEDPTPTETADVATLPVTGPSTTGLVIVGSGVILIGASLILLARRRAS